MRKHRMERVKAAEERVSIGSRIGDLRTGDSAVTAHTIFDHDRLLRDLSDPLPQDSRKRVYQRAWRLWHEDPDCL